MQYLVMECHPGYAVVLSADGRFLKAANLHYEVGQTVDSIVEMKTPAAPKPHMRSRWAAIAACFCMLLLGAWQMLWPVGTVEMRINPHVRFSVNRFDRVTHSEALNDDGQILLEQVATFGKHVDVLADELADKAVELGYLSAGGRITLEIASADDSWRSAKETQLAEELDRHFAHTITIEITKSADSTGAAVIPIPSAPAGETSDKPDKPDPATDYSADDYTESVEPAAPAGVVDSDSGYAEQAGDDDADDDAYDGSGTDDGDSGYAEQPSAEAPVTDSGSNYGDSSYDDSDDSDDESSDGDSGYDN